MSRHSPLVLLAPPATAVAIVAAALLILVGVPWWLALLLGLTLAGATGWALWLRGDRVALDALGADPIDSADEPRLANVVEGLCVTHGHPEPALYRVESQAPNAAILGRSARDAHLVVTTGLLAQLDRLELEAVVARVLSQLNGIESGTALASLAAIASPFGLRDVILDRALDDRSMMEVDIDAVQLTRYPPALASAYEKAAGLEPIESSLVADHLWLLGTASSRPRGVAHPPLADRIDVLREL